jgi:hypothetical protein
VRLSSSISLHLIANSTVDWLLSVLFAPSVWSQKVNGYLYQYVALALQTSQAHSIKIAGGRKYNVPSGNIALEDPFEGEPHPNVTTYSEYAISGADFSDGSATVKEVFDIVVKTTREITPTCELTGGLKPVPLRCVNPCSRSSRGYLVTWVCRESTIPGGYLLIPSSSALSRPFGQFVRLRNLPPTALSNSSTRFL